MVGVAGLGSVGEVGVGLGVAGGGRVGVAGLGSDGVVGMVGAGGWAGADGAGGGAGAGVVLWARHAPPVSVNRTAASVVIFGGFIVFPLSVSFIVRAFLLFG